MSENKEYLLNGLNEHDLKNLRSVLDEELGSKNNIGKPRTEPLGSNPPFDGDADIWQPSNEGDACVLVFNQTNAVHASGINSSTRLGELLKELSKMHNFEDKK